MKKFTLFLITCFMITSLSLLTSCKDDEEPKVLATVTTTDATAITSTSFTTGGEITNGGGSDITQRGIVWATHAEPAVTDNVTDDGTGTGSFVTNLTELQTNTTYYIRAYAINGTGTAYGNEISVTTSAGLATVTTAAITGVAGFSAVGGGDVVNDGGATITARGICWSATANPTVDGTKTVDGNGSGAFTSELTNLEPEATYHVRAYATNSFGTSYGEDVTFATNSNLTVEDVDGNTYAVVKIGEQYWTTSNLKTTKYRNGEALTNGLTGYDWNAQSSGAYTFPGASENNKETLGLLYNLASVSDSRGLCPSGWHVPTDNEWKILEISQGMSQSDANAFDLRGTIGAKLLEGGASGLNLQKAGYMFSQGVSYDFVDHWGVYFGVSNDPLFSFVRIFNMNEPDAGPIYRSPTDNSYIMSIRCIRD